MPRSETPQGFEPSYASFTSIEHYYGSAVRELLLGAAILMLVTSPLYADQLTSEFPFEVLGAIVAVCCAALTNPYKRWVMGANAVVSGVGFVIFQSWAIMDFDASDPIAFVLREAISIVWLFALYFSMKTFRAMTLHQIGTQSLVEEDEEEDEDVDPYKDDGEGMD